MKILGGKDTVLRMRGLDPEEHRSLRDCRAFFNLPPIPTGSNMSIVGILILPDGERCLIQSGKIGGPFGGTHRGGIPRGKGSGFSAHVLTHVEGHAAAIMHERKVPKATLWIEKCPCQSCDREATTPNISAILPPGSMLTIIDPGSASTYRSSQG